jgi:tetratricopeptide (TPR) repeat protein/transcriptional regulator with XRE-family HTH domain
MRTVSGCRTDAATYRGSVPTRDESPILRADGVAFGRWVRRRRVELHLTQEELADRAAVSVRSVQLLEAGRVAGPRPTTRRLLTGVLREPVREAFGRVVPAQLPIGVRDFVGREAQLTELAGIEAPAIVTVTGTAGVGKTALVVHWAHRMACRFGDGQLYVDLRGFDPSGTPMRPGEALRMFLDALGVPAHRIPPGLDAQAALYRSVLAERALLVVVDNVRDVEQLRPLLPGSPASLTLVTSRHRLTGLAVTYGAHQVRLERMSVEEARDLLASRLSAARVDREPDAAAVIIDRCVRLPLALSVVAARAAGPPAFTMKQLADQLGGDTLDELDGGDPMSDVRAVLSWSYRSLSAGAAGLLRMLGVHPGPHLGVHAAASLTGRPVRDTRTDLTELLGAHLITESAPGRYGLHDLLRAYAAERAEAEEPVPERHAALERAVEHYLATAHRARQLLAPGRDLLCPAPPRPGVSTVALADEAGAARWFAVEHPVLCDAVRVAADAGLDLPAYQLALTCGIWFQRRGAWQDQIDLMRVAVTAATRLGDLSSLLIAHAYLGQAHTLQGDHEEALAQLGTALDLARTLGDDTRTAQVHQSLAVVYDRQARHVESLAHAEEAYALYRHADPKLWAMACSTLGWYRARNGDCEQAVRDCAEALELYEKQGDGAGIASTLHSLGYAFHRLGRYTDARECFTRSIAVCAEVGERYFEAMVRSHLGDALLADGDPAAAREAWTRAAEILDELGHAEADEVRDKLRISRAP